MTKPERPQEMVLALNKHFTDVAYLGLVSVIVNAGVWVDISDKYGCTTLMETTTEYTSDVIFECITSPINKQINLLLEKREKSKLSMASLMQHI